METLPELQTILFLCAVALAAGFIDTLAGGGGLIVLPALIVSGVPPLAALGTNKLQSTFGTATATLMMMRMRKVRWREVRFWMLSAFIGSALGTVAVQFVDPSALTFVIPIVLVIIAAYFLLSSVLAKLIKPGNMSDLKFGLSAVPAIGFYDGMFGPGTGSFYAFSGVAAKGWDLIRSTAVAKCLNFSTNLASLIVFALAGQMVWTIGLCMMLGQLLGAFLGARVLVKIPVLLLRSLVVLMCMAMLIRYLCSV